MSRKVCGTRQPERGSQAPGHTRTKGLGARRSQPVGIAVTPRIYHLHPLVAGRWERWAEEFARVRALGFDHICSAPPFVPGESGDIFVTADHERLHPALAWDGGADDGLSGLAAMAGEHDLRLMLDIKLEEVAGEAALRQRQPDWFSSSGFSGGTPDPRLGPQRLGVGHARFQDTEAAEGLTAWWSDRLQRLVRAGVAGFRCLEPQRVPPAIWRRLIQAVHTARPDCLMLAWTPGIDRASLTRLSGLGFDFVCASGAWWDGREPWLIDELEALRSVAPALASPEPSFAERLAMRLPPGSDLPLAYRHAIRRAAAIGDGLFVPMGFEFAARFAFDAATSKPADLDRARREAPADLSPAVAEGNALVEQIAGLDLSGSVRSLTPPTAAASALLRTDEVAARDASRAALVLINPALEHGAGVPVSLSPLPPEAGAPLGSPRPLDGDADPAAPLSPGEVRILLYGRAADITGALPAGPVEREPMEETRIAIEAIEPIVPGGDYAVKRVVGDTVTVSADIIADGHEMLAAALLWRPADETRWRRVPMRLVNNDNWEARFTPERVGPHFFTVEAWWDVWGTFRHDLHAKHAAGQALALEIEEGRRMIEAAMKRVGDGREESLRGLLKELAATADESQKVELLLSNQTLASMQAADAHPFSAQHPPLRLDVDRPQAIFASWYELFPRSETADPDRHGTFRDVIARLPAIRAMGFDVLYFPPIHPIGRVNRKGRNNSLRAQPGDVGSPYAIGAEEGGHDAVHPQLGTLDDFRALVTAAKQHGLEIAIDFAVQCAPDHPWIKQHPDWFRWRPDGSMRYAENPPKKYEDIVNPDFYAEAAMPALWLALRDVIQFWCDQGVRIFRVDNPHTKPIPFWRWMIADIRDRHPDALFLAEAFTRPKVMYRLAKAGFNQSYTYFTWRNTKQEITEYLTELNAAPVRDFFRPNFFVNTPDINPIPLQTSGRAGFLARAALATTLSGLWGMYSGFEICESAPLPGREEYLDSEKYEIRVRDWNTPGNIIPEITALNHIRRAHPALQTHLGITFYNAFNDQILLYGKRVPGAREIILVAVSFDFRTPQQAGIEIPLWEFGLPDHASLNVVDLMRGHRFTWTGKNQFIRLDPAELPFSIWQLTPQGAL